MKDDSYINKKLNTGIKLIVVSGNLIGKWPDLSLIPREK